MLSDKKFTFDEYSDYILNWFALDVEEYSMQDLTPRFYVSSYTVGSKMVEKYPELNSHHFSFYLELILNRIAEDGYIDKKPNPHKDKVDTSKYLYSVKLPAFEFRKKGGYKKKQKKEKWDNF